jgi:hypothetical protein
LKNLTICLPYYRNEGMLDVQLKRFAALPIDLKSRLSLIVVDDGSSLLQSDERVLPASAKAAQWRDIGMKFDLYAMDVNIRWNQDACRNLAVANTDTKWVLLTDIDHIVPRITIDGLLKSKFDPARAYRFSRKTFEGVNDKGNDILSDYKPHPNSWIMTCESYWKMGGYDESLAGWYGTDGDFRHRIDAVLGSPIDLPFPLYRVPRDVVPDASTSTYERKALIDGALKTALTKRNHTPGWRPLHLSFPWHQVH